MGELKKYISTYISGFNTFKDKPMSEIRVSDSSIATGIAIELY